MFFQIYIINCLNIFKNFSYQIFFFIFYILFFISPYQRAVRRRRCARKILGKIYFYKGESDQADNDINNQLGNISAFTKDKPVNNFDFEKIGYYKYKSNNQLIIECIREYPITEFVLSKIKYKNILY